VDAGADGAPVLVKRATDEGGRARLATEAALLRALAHPGTVQVTALVEEAGAVELHLAWAGSHTLATVTGLPPPAAAGLVAQVADTVADLHRAGLVHGRLTPDHVLLGPTGRPVLTGLAEAGRADRVPVAGDVAALGALLTGLVAPADDGLQLPERRPRPGRGTDRGLRGALLTLADQAQADDPAARPTAAELAALLRATAPLDPGGPRRHRPRPARRPAMGRHRPRPDTGAGTRRPRWGRRLVVAGLGLGLGAAGLAAIGPRAPDPGPGVVGATPSTTHPTPAPPRPGPVSPAPERSRPGPSGDGPAPAPRAPGGATGPGGCVPVRGAEAQDTDGDGCPEGVRVAGRRVSVGATTWVVGDAGDRSAVGDWDCDGTATVAVLRPATGEVFVYDRWVGPGAELTVRPTARAPGADALVGRDGDGDGCPQLTATGPGGLAVAVGPPPP